MTNFEKIKSMTREELVAWLDYVMSYLEEDVYGWFDEKYCNKCESETCYVELLDKECECSYCELYDNCRFFEKVPSGEEIINLWLDEEYKQIEEDKNVCN